MAWRNAVGPDLAKDWENVMAVLNVRDLEGVRRNMKDWLANQMPNADEVDVSEFSMPATSGFSNDTIFFHARWTRDGQITAKDLVARFAPRGPKLFPDYNLEMQFSVMKALGEHTSLPVPEMLWFEESDEPPLHGPFYVMGRVDGKVAVDDPIYLREGWVMELSATNRAKFYKAGLTALAQVHAVNWKDLGLSGLARPDLGETPLRQLVEYYEKYYVFARRKGVSYPVIDAAFNWVRENIPPEEGETVLVWGDARPGNLIYKSDLSIGAVVDWELAFLGERELDLAWWLVTQTGFSAGMGLPLPEGILDTAKTIALYESLTGYTPKNLDFHLRFAALRCSLMMVRFCTLMTEAGMMPEASTVAHDNPLNQTLAHLMGMSSTLGQENVLNLSL